MKRKIRIGLTVLVVLIVLTNLTLLTFFIVRALVVTTTHKNGFDEWDPEASPLVGDRLVEKEFLTTYPYRDGGFRWYCKKGFYFSLWAAIPDFGMEAKAEKSFVWLTYDDEESYRNAKQSRIDAEKDAFDHSLDGTVAFGYTFYIIDDFISWRGSNYPNEFTAFGYNDETRTLVFLGLLSGKKSNPRDYLEESFAALLEHYYGEWFDWE